VLGARHIRDYRFILRLKRGIPLVVGFALRMLKEGGGVGLSMVGERGHKTLSRRGSVGDQPISSRTKVERTRLYREGARASASISWREEERSTWAVDVRR
jgi:hypothetical protein